MSLQSGATSQSAAKSCSTNADNTSVDAQIELLEEPHSTLPRDNNEEMCWVANSDSSEQVGPLSAIEVRKQIASGAISPNAFVWRKGMPQWARVHEVFDISRTLSSGAEASVQPPPLIVSKTLTAGEIFNFVLSWNPPVSVFRGLARIAFAVGVLILVVSLILAPFGMSWFSGGLQAVLIAAVLELAAVVRGTLPASTRSRAWPDTKEDCDQP